LILTVLRDECYTLNYSATKKFIVENSIIQCI